MSRTVTRLDPVPAFRFTISFDGLPPGGFTDCTGLQMETEVTEYAEGGLNTHTWRLAGRSKQSNITLQRGIVSKALWDWYHATSRGDFLARNGTILVLDTSGTEEVLEFELTEAFPVKWIGPALSAGQNNLAIETLELAHQGFARRR
jgi:phage tail-like protein